GRPETTASTATADAKLAILTGIGYLELDTSTAWPLIITSEFAFSTS
ncbi:hypothetical protein BVRB_032060, partial [Beta vulgaris subsp. vulgaris]